MGLTLIKNKFRYDLDSVIHVRIFIRLSGIFLKGFFKALFECLFIFDIFYIIW